MVCIAAFIILCLISVFIAILSIFRRDIGKKYWKTFKKAWGCVWKKVRLQKCETNFKEDVKNSILKKVVIKKPKLVKPLSVAIEVVSVLIVLVTIWSLVEAAKAGLSLYAFGTCNVKKPESCLVSGATYCPLETGGGNWFTEWGDIFAEIPDKLKNWNAADYLPDPAPTKGPEDAPLALDIFDPGCDKCLASYRNQLAAGFFDSHKVALLPYSIKSDDGAYRFLNSDLFARYLTAAPDAAWNILNRLFTENDETGTVYQSAFKNSYSAEKAAEILNSWLADFGYSPEEVAETISIINSDEISAKIAENRRIAEEKVHIRGIPTTIYDGKKHTGVYE
jgi:hypothetical protein